MASTDLGKRLGNYNGASLEEGLRLARELVAAGRWNADTAPIVRQLVAVYHGDEGERRLDAAVREAKRTR